jgi:hypothetical protein
VHGAHYGQTLAWFQGMVSDGLYVHEIPALRYDEKKVSHAWPETSINGIGRNRQARCNAQSVDLA